MTGQREGIEVRPISGALGAEILGVDLAGELDKERFEVVRRAYDDHGVIFFRDQSLSPEQHIAFARRWGRINVNRFFHPVDGHPNIAEVRKEPDQKTNIGSNWHTDHSYDAIPAMGSILYAHEVPEAGGDTLFANMALAYEALSEGMRTMLQGLRALHSSRHVFGPAREERYDKEEFNERIGNPGLAVQDAVHPVVLEHPRTGRKGLYVNPTFTLRFEGWSDEESKPLLEYLYKHAERPEFSCRFRWRKGSIAFWDNLATWHLALNDYPGERRLMHRITLEGVPID